MNAESKSLFLSTTFWGIVIGFLSQLAARKGWYFPGDLTGLTNDVAGVVGTLVAIYGRVRASKPVHIITPQ